MKVLSLLFLAAAVAGCGISLAGPPASPATTLPPTTSLPRPTTVSPSTTVPESTTSTAPDELTGAVDAFRDWVGALAEGEVERAWDLMAPSSREAFGTYDRFLSMRTAMAEGWGSWVAAENPSYSLEEDEGGRTLLVAEGTVRPEGNVEDREVGVPVVRHDGDVLISPFEEFGNVAEGLRETEGSGPPVPPDSGSGRRVVYSNAEQRVWLVDADESVRDTYLVSGRKGVPAPGSYEVFSKSEVASAGHDGITMSHMVRFAHGKSLAIGFHAIPNDGNGRPLQSEDELGEYRSAGCVRQSPGQAAALFEWADVGTPVIVLP